MAICCPPCSCRSYTYRWRTGWRDCSEGKTAVSRFRETAVLRASPPEDLNIFVKTIQKDAKISCNNRGKAVYYKRFNGITLPTLTRHDRRILPWLIAAPLSRRLVKKIANFYKGDRTAGHPRSRLPRQESSLLFILFLRRQSDVICKL